MNWVVLPLDAMHTKPHFAPWDTWLTGLFVHMFAIGLSISLSAAKMEPGPKENCANASDLHKKRTVGPDGIARR